VDPPPSFSRDALRLVLFGMPDAGKSSLLGALAQAALTQEHLLNGHLTDLTHGLAELQERLYEDRPRETLEEVVPYPAIFEPFTAGAARQNVILIDCDGRAANELLARRRSLEGEHTDTSLAGKVLEADGLILAVDASASQAQMDADFTEFGKFLRTLQQSRGRRSEVGGLPVFLVLTKCDLLAKEEETPTAWLEHIEDRKRQVHQRFKDFVAGQTEDGPPPFGSIELHLWATAVKRPALADTPARPREPYGVAELFRQTIEEAESHRGRKQTSQRRLLLTVGGVVGTIAAMIALATTFITGNTVEKPSPLLNAVDNYRSNEGPTASTRLRSELVQRHIRVLTELKNSPEFGTLSLENQEYVAQRLRELTDYQAYRDRLLRETAPASAASDDKLDEIEARLKGDLLPPAEYQAEWGQTEAAQLREQRLADVTAIRQSVLEAEHWYKERSRTYSDLVMKVEFKPQAPWHKEVREFLAVPPPFTPTDRLPNSAAVTYATALAFSRVTDARQEWEKVRLRLETLRDLTAMLGLAGPLPSQVAALEIPPGFEVDDTGGRLRDLKKLYPSFEKWPEELQSLQVEKQLPESAVADVRRAVDASYRNAIAAGQKAVLKQLEELAPDKKETPQRWEEVRKWLVGNPAELAAWRQLTTLLARLRNPNAEDPIAALAEFLRQSRFNLDLRSLTLDIPDDLNVRPTGKLTIYHQSGGEARPSLVYVQRGAGQRDEKKRVTSYTFAPEGGTTLTYKPGDDLWADLPVNKDGEGKDRKLFWSGLRSMVYQFERLKSAPRLQRKDNKGDVATGVELIVSYVGGGLPRIPDLLPPVEFKK